MQLDKIEQPKIININKNLRLTVLDKDDWKIALNWYHNPQVLYYSEGIDNGKTYNINTINRMYTYLSQIGELYFIEILEDNKWIIIGDVTLSEKNMPIVLGDERYWGKRIGYTVLSTLIDRAKSIGIKELYVPTVYSYNIRSQNLFKSLGFIEFCKDDLNKSYSFKLQS